MFLIQLLETLPLTEEERADLRRWHSDDFNRVMQRLGYETRAIPGTSLHDTKLALEAELTRRNHA